MATDNSKKIEASSNGAEEELPNFATWEEEATGFPPYWTPEEGKWFFGKLVDKDTSDPDFVRYMVQAAMRTECKRGPAEDAEPVIVEKGSFFTISVYSGLQQNFDFYLNTGLSPAMRVETTGKVSTKANRDVYTWKLMVSKEDKKKLNAARTKLMLDAKKTEVIGTDGKKLPVGKQAEDSAS